MKLPLQQLQGLQLQATLHQITVPLRVMQAGHNCMLTGSYSTTLLCPTWQVCGRVAYTECRKR